MGLERRFAEASALIRLGERINEGLRLEEVLDQIFDSFHAILPYDRIGCSMLENEGRTVRAVWARTLGSRPRLGLGYSAPLAGSSLARIIETGRPRILNDLEQYLREHPGSASTRLVVSEGVRYQPDLSAGRAGQAGRIRLLQQPTQVTQATWSLLESLPLWSPLQTKSIKPISQTAMPRSLMFFLISLESFFALP